jgi:hypothetical protein
MKKLIGFVALGAMVLVAGSNLSLAGVERDSRENGPRNPQIYRSETPARTLDVPGLFNALMKWFVGNHNGREFPGNKDRNRNIQDAPEQTEMGVGGCRGVGGCSGWI